MKDTPLPGNRRARAAMRNHHDTGVETKSTTLASKLVALHSMADAGWTDSSYTALAREGFMRNPIVHRCVRMIAEASAAVPWLAYEGATEMSGHAALERLRKPNNYQTASSFLEAIYGHIMLAGNAYVERVSGVGDTMVMHVLRPDRVTLTHDDNGWPDGYRYQVDTRKRHVSLGDNPLGVSPLLHISQFHPLDDQAGFAPLQAALMALDIHNAAGRWNKALLDNAARPSGALVYAPGDNTNMTPDQFERLKNELEDGYTGVMNAGRPLLLEGGLDWKAMGLSPRDMDFIEAKNAASRDIALAFGVPPMLLGIPGDNTYANYQEANRAFYRLTVLPLVNRVAEAFTNWFAPEQAADFRFAYDEDKVSGLSAERDALWERLEQVTFLTRNEKREAVGYTPLAGAEQP